MGRMLNTNACSIRVVLVGCILDQEELALFARLLILLALDRTPFGDCATVQRSPSSQSGRYPYFPATPVH